ncbi:hypothetical protein RHMOL_Rhmol08G0264200 [Rhododendron molle]|uniref:Uncharacterized protein n=1 Tax=Rhododendron molle TaxID=49168 RepID=A0ACC0MSN9_RHOML|nr:hypothetical protein RHMOL_Rhmol08G0264200 [Rhododendron molle]
MNDLNYAPQEPEMWPVSKILTSSDTSVSNAKLHFPKRPFEERVVGQMDEEQKKILNADPFRLAIQAVDDDTNERREVIITNVGSGYNISNKWGEVIRKKKLKAKQVIRVRWADSCLHFTVPPQYSN